MKARVLARITLGRGLGPPFAWMWGAQAAAQIGAQIGLVAIPLTAVLLLNATQRDMAIIVAAEYAPNLLLALVAGSVVNSSNARSVMIASDLGRLMLLLMIPLLHIGGNLQIPILVLIGFGVGTLTLFFDLAYQSTLPRIVRSHDLLKANGTLETTRVVTTAVGPSAAAGLVVLLGPVLPLLVQCCTYLLSGLCVARIRPHVSSETPLDVTETHLVRIRMGLRAVRADLRQVSIIALATTSNAAFISLAVLMPLYLTRSLKLPAPTLGIILSAGALGGVAAGWVLGKDLASVPRENLLRAGLICAGLGYGLIPAASFIDGSGYRLAMLSVAEVITTGALTVVAATCMTWRQTITPADLLARVLATGRTVVFGLLPGVALLTGFLAERFGNLPVLLSGSILLLLAPLWIVSDDSPRARDLS
jgi:Transmembrane secretion effector